MTTTEQRETIARLLVKIPKLSTAATLPRPILGPPQGGAGWTHAAIGGVFHARRAVGGGNRYTV